MKRLVVIFLGLLILLISSCASVEKQQYLSEEQSFEIMFNHLYFSKDGYCLKFSEESALKHSISSQVFRKFQQIFHLADISIKEQIQNLGGKDSLCLFFPKERVDTNGLDPKIKIKNICKNIQLFQTRAFLGSIHINTLGNTPDVTNGRIPEGTINIKYGASAKSIGAFIKGYIDASGVREDFSGWQIWGGVSGEITPGLLPGMCELYLFPTGCEVSATANFYSIE